jgi:FkbM family methyltransferase
MLGSRDFRTVATSIFRRQHYIALFNMVKVYPNFVENLFRYLTGRGEYPYDIKVRTPIGIFEPRLYSHHDLLTVNEIFCRGDYFAGKDIRTVVDLGSNIGISALYFLTRNNESQCYLYEPDERNIVKLKQNLAGFEKRYRLVQAAVSNESGKLEFGIESTGRYGGLRLKTGKTIEVDCLNINDVLNDILEGNAGIDLLKIDTEGVEIRTVKAIDPTLASKIRQIHLEAQPDHDLYPDLFTQQQYGSVCRMTRKNA